MNIYELIEGKKTHGNLRSTAMWTIKMHQNSNPTAESLLWLKTICTDKKLDYLLKKELARYNVKNTSLTDTGDWLQTASIFAEALNILDEYRTEMEIMNGGKIT